MRKILLIAAAPFLMCIGVFVVLVAVVFLGPESATGRILERGYPVWGWVLGGCDSTDSPLPCPQTLDEIRGRYLASKTYHASGWNFIGTGMSSTLLVGINDPERPIQGVPQLGRCEITYLLRPEDLADGDHRVTCVMRDGRAVEFVAYVWSYPCFAPYWLAGYNRRMVELLSADGNWPPTDERYRMTLATAQRGSETLSKLEWPH